MKLTRRWISALAGFSLVLGLSAALASPASAAAPPYEPDPNASLGSIAFYNASGAVVTSGTNLNHLFDYAVASTASARTTTKATAIFAFPDHTKPDSTTWFKANATASTNYPNPAAPAPVKNQSHPTASAQSSEADLGALLSTTTLDTTPGYANIVQIQLHDSGPGLPNGYQSSPFWASDIMFNQAANTWQQVYPAVAASTTTTLSASPAKAAAPGTPVTFTAKLSPTAAAGTVQFSVDGTSVGSPVTVASGAATYQTSTLTAGTHSVKAVFTPANAMAYAASTSTALSYLIANTPGAPTAVKAVAAHASAKVSWTAPSSTGGSAIVGYNIEYSANGGAFTSASATFHSSTATTQTVTGLTNGTSYTFKVAAINAVGTGAYSAVSAAVKPFADPTALTISKGVTVASGKSTVVSGTLTDTTTKAVLSGQSVVLYSRAGTTGTFAKGGTATTTSKGVASFTVKPTAKTQYELKFTGTTSYATSTSAASTVTVGTAVMVAAKPKPAMHGKVFVVWGTTVPGKPGLKATLQHKVRAAFKKVATMSTRRQKLPNGRTRIGFVFTVKERARGKYTFRVVLGATKALKGSTSRLIIVRIK